jgi:hypothetical protein
MCGDEAMCFVPTFYARALHISTLPPRCGAAMEHAYGGQVTALWACGRLARTLHRACRANAGRVNTTMDARMALLQYASWNAHVG